MKIDKLFDEHFDVQLAFNQIVVLATLNELEQLLNNNDNNSIYTFTHWEYVNTGQ